MKAITKCPKCKEVLTTDCEGCVSGGSVSHICEGEKEWDITDVEWKIVECTKEEEENLKKLGFEGKFPEV